MSLDIILYAVVAVALLVRLWFVLGRRNDDEQQRPNPFVKPAPNPAEEEIAGLNLEREKPPLLFKPLQVAPGSLAGGLEQIKALDASFDEKAFLRKAREHFQAVVESFAKGDLSTVEKILGPNVLPRFREAIEARQKAGQTMESRIVRIKDVETVTAKTEDNQAILTVRFVTEQENTLRDAQGKIIGGAAGNIEEITDLWTFARDTKSIGPDWILIQTHS
ncbi:MAG: Tim44/TimA family putative adaptor protein [Alphaproteobacteria bacterium]|nr:Tim44/TimA family putative adaptor protein [Alphaproteobacteria bacterium]